MKAFLNSGRSQGSALIVCLAILALLLIATLVFFTKSQNLRTLESSGAARVRSEIFARSALEYTVGLLTKEMTDASASHAVSAGNGVVFKPVSPQNMLPKLEIRPTLAFQKDSHVPSILKQSLPAMDPNATSIPTDAKNRQGRFIEKSRWTEGRLWFGARPGLTPDWIYFDEEGATNKASPTILGRASFIVFGINNLIDISVSGFPKYLSDDIRSINKLKGTLAGANISRIGYIVPLLKDPDIQLVDHRNRRSVRSRTYLEHILSDTNGLVDPAPGDTQLVSRLDLLRFHKRLEDTYGFIFNPNILAYMSPILRAYEAPTWDPPTPTPENSFALTLLRSTDATITDYFADGTTRTRKVKAGDPVAARRFPLTRLSWLESTNPQRNSALAQYFGLEPTGPKQWRYRDAHIKTLEELKNESREPNFFEMLKASIVSGSLGQSFSTVDAGITHARDRDPDLHILRIGASIIDSAGTDNLPTVLTLGGDTVCGIKDLPYLHEVRFPQVIKKSTAGVIEQIDQFALPILVNPHANPLINTAPRPPIRVRLVGTFDTSEATVDTTIIPLTSRYSAQNPIGQRVLDVDANAFRSPSPAILPANAAGTVDLPAYYTPNENRTLGFWLATATGSGQNIGATTPLTGTIEVGGFNVILEYWNGAAWIAYDALIGNGESYGLSEKVFFASAAYADPDEDSFAIPATPYLLKPDPRTTRWGIARGKTSTNPFYLKNISRNRIVDFPDETVDSYVVGMTRAGPFPAIPDPDGETRENDLQIGSVVPDQGIKEMKHVLADYLSGERLRGNASPPLSEDRNAIRHQPFFTVAELGGVFRDQPWKTLDFATAKSGDGALLDYFSINEVGETPIVAGRVNLNLQSPPDTFDPQLIDTSILIGGDVGLPPVDAEWIRTFLVRATEAKPLLSPAELVGKLDPSVLPDHLKLNKQRREIMARALGSAGQTRTWNYYVDLIAQIGSMSPKNSTNLEKAFLVQGEYRFWLHIAIDRFTGKVVDSHIEAYQE